MATRIYGLSQDEVDGHKAVTEGVGSATTDSVEVTIDLAKVGNRQEAVELLTMIIDYIQEGDWPPA